MNYNATYRKITLILTGVIVMMTAVWNRLSAQTNVASSAFGTVATHSAGGTGAGSSSQPPNTAGYGPSHYNNDTLVKIGQFSFSPAYDIQDQSYVSSGGWIEFAFPSNVTFNKVVIYKESRPMTNAVFQYYNTATASYVDFYTYENYINNEQDSVTFPAVTTTKFRINNVVSLGNGNPNFREIRVLTPATVACAGAPTVSAASVTLIPSVAVPSYLQPDYQSTINTCPGKLICLSAYNLPFTTGLSFQWKKGGTPIPGATNRTYVFNAYETANYTVTVSCGASSNTSNIVAVNVSAQSFASLPYYQGFDNAWTNSSCVSGQYARDIPGDGYWSNSPSFGNTSWRIDSTGTYTSGWTGSIAAITAQSGGRFARFHSSAAPSFNAGNLELYVNCSGAGDKALYFYQINTMGTTNDSLIVYLSTDNGANFTRIGGWDTAISWRRRWLPIQSTSAQTIIRFQGMRKNSDGTDIGIDSVYIAPPCSGSPVAGTITQASPTLGCPGSVYTLYTSGTSMAGDLVYQWEYSNNSVQWFPACGPSANGLIYTTPAIYDSIYYRMGVKCGTGGSFVYTPPLALYIAQPTYAPIPFSENFNSTWMSLASGNTCGTRPLPSMYFANQPTTGNNSWRRNDDGTGTWSNANNGSYTPTGVTGVPGDYSARFHSNQTPGGVAGSLDLLVDCSGTAGTKELSFAMINAQGNDSLRVLYSTDAGCSFTYLQTFFTATSWTFNTVPVPSNSATTIVRFQAYSDFGASDIGIDSVRMVPPCVGTPNAGVINATPPCPGVNFTMNISGYSQAASITYQWFESASGNPGSFTPIANATTTTYTTNISATMYYYVVLTCNNTTLTDTTPVKMVPVANFYYCYCNSGATSTSGSDIGNFTIKSIDPVTSGQATHLNNGSATPSNNNANATNTYTDYRNTISPIIMYHDSTYILSVSQINSSSFTASTVSVWIDTNRDGVFQPTERFMNRSTSLSSNPAQTVKDTFVMLNTAQVGITGLRVVMEQPTNGTPAPCGTFTYGETEDYLINISYPPCDGPVDPGVSYISDTASCVGYTVTVADTSHERERSGIEWVWQYSPDGNSWANILGSQGHDSVTQVVTGPVFYRMRLICYNTLDTSYSNVQSVSINPAVSCYCFSQAIGGTDGDSSDIGAFYMDDIAINVGGPHLKNQEAYRMRTDYTHIATPELWVDSSYALSIYHIMRSDDHADAKITVFMDFNANLRYDIPEERVWTTYATANHFTVDTIITIPHNAIPDAPVGMRLVLNNDVSPNIPSDSACGTYTSGETEDYVVIFRTPLSGVNDTKNLTWMNVFPNPNEGKFTISFTATKAVSRATVTVSSVTGQKIQEQEYNNAGREFSQQIDLTGMPRGVYFVELRADAERYVRKVVIK